MYTHMYIIEARIFCASIARVRASFLKVVHQSVRCSCVDVREHIYIMCIFEYTHTCAKIATSVVVRFARRQTQPQHISHILKTTQIQHLDDLRASHSIQVNKLIRRFRLTFEHIRKMLSLFAIIEKIK